MGAVLSVIGTILLALLKIILIVFLLICFLLVCPACYKGKVDYHQTLTVEGRLFWLFGVLYISFVYRNGDRESHIRFFGMDVQKLMARRTERKNRKIAKKSKKRQKRNRNKGGTSGKRASENQQKIVRNESEDESSTIVENNGSCSRQASPAKSQEEFAEQEKIWEAPLGEEPFEENTSDGKEAFWQKLSFYRFLEKFFSFIRAIRQFFSSLCSILKKVRQKVEWAGEVKIFWQSENTRRMVCILKDNVLHLWRKLKPKVLQGKIIFGAGDPCLTGQLLGAAAIVYASCGRGIQVTPDFEQVRLEGNLLVKGSISLITILIILIRIFLRGEWSQFKREAEQLKEAL